MEERQEVERARFVGIATNRDIDPLNVGAPQVEKGASQVRQAPRGAMAKVKEKP